MSNAYLECAGSLLETLTALGGHEGPDMDASIWRQRILEDLEQFTLRARARDLPGQGIQDARYALAALVDERAMSGEESLARDWAAHPLQVALFGDYHAGEGFFERLAGLRRHPHDHVDLLELYLCCLYLGLEGIYRLRGPQGLQSLKGDLRDQLRELRPPPQTLRDPHVPRKTAARPWRLALWARGISLLLLTLIPMTAVFHGWQLHLLARDLEVTLQEHAQTLSRMPAMSVDAPVLP